VFSREVYLNSVIISVMLDYHNVTFHQRAGVCPPSEMAHKYVHANDT
jgi:hypothetical protein